MNKRYPLTAVMMIGLLVMLGACSDVGDDVKKVGPEDSESEANGPGPKDADAPEAFTQTESGLRYRVLRKGDGKKPTAADSVTVHYRGSLDDGTVFDSSYPRGETATFGLRGVVAGWTEGLQLVAEGGMIELEIPPSLGYGAKGQGSIGPNATLHFIVEVFDVEAAPDPGDAPAPASRRSAETDAMLEGFILQDLPPAATQPATTQPATTQPDR